MSVTYANHAALLTGADPMVTGLWGNYASAPEGGFIPTPLAGPRAVTLFDRCTASDRRSLSIIGDQYLTSTNGAHAASVAWPETAELPEGTETDTHRFATDVAVLEQIGRAELDAGFVFLHLNEPDSTLHDFGPGSAEAADQLRASDSAYGQVLKMLEPRWEDTVLFTVSDHEQEATTHPEAVDIGAAIAAHGWGLAKTRRPASCGPNQVGRLEAASRPWRVATTLLGAGRSWLLPPAGIRGCTVWRER